MDAHKLSISLRLPCYSMLGNALRQTRREELLLEHISFPFLELNQASRVVALWHRSTLLRQAWTVRVCAVRRYINFVCGRVRRAGDADVYLRQEQRLHEEHLGNFLQGSIRLAEPEREGTLLRARTRGHCCFTKVSLPGRVRTQWKSSNIRVEEESVPWGTKPSSAEVFSQY